MPYIDKERREAIRDGAICESVGELNFAITREISFFLDKERLSYSNINAAIGVLECAKLELYRRISAPYEDKKMKENGDVFPSSLLLS